MEYILLYPFIEIVAGRTHKHTLHEIGKFTGLYQTIHLRTDRGWFVIPVDSHALAFLQYLSEMVRKRFSRFGKN